MTRSCSDLVAAVSTAGCQVTLAGERLIVRPAAKVPANLIEPIRANKPALVAYLRSRPTCLECRQPIIEPVRSWWGGEPVHHACGVAAWERDLGGRIEPEEPPALVEPQPWTAADWREHFEERVAVAVVDGGVPEAEARRLAWQACVARWCEMYTGTDRDQAAQALRAMVKDEAGAAPSPRDTDGGKAR